MKWWSKCTSMAIAKTASTNVAFKAARLGDSTFERQSEILMTEDVTVINNSPSHDEEDFDDDFDDDFEEPVEGEYEIDDDEFADNVKDMPAVDDDDDEIAPDE